MDFLDRLHEVLEDFSKNTKNPEKFIGAQPQLGSSFTECAKRLFDFCSECPAAPALPSQDGLSELVTAGLDGEQIWQEIELTNGPLLKSSVHGVAKALAGAHRVTLLCDPTERSRKDDDNDDDDDDDDASVEEEEEEGDEEEEYDGSQDLFRDASDASPEAAGDANSSESETDFDVAGLEGESRRPAPAGRRAEAVPGRKSVVDDNFFKLAEMERFLEMEDAREERRRRREEAGGGEEEEEEDVDEDDDDQLSVDLFDEFPSSDEESGEENEKSARDVRYRDYFENDGRTKKAARGKRVRFQEFDGDDSGEEEMGESDEELEEKSQRLSRPEKESDEEEEEEEEEMEEEEESEGEDLADILRGQKDSQSTFEQRQEKLKKKIAQLEEANIAQKPWQLTGEAKSSKRPENSLLEETLDFEVASRPAPAITEETTQALEDIIRQRVLDRAWDDVERKERKQEAPYEFKKRVSLDQEKSKLSLAQIYEKEYLKQAEQLKEEEEDPAHTDIKKMMDALFVKLDALSNFHFMPKPVLPEVKIVKNVASISMEEVAPITASEASLLAPEEIQEKSTAELKGDTEKTTGDRRQARRKKKKGQKLQAKERLQEQTAQEAKAGAAAAKTASVKGALKSLEQDSKRPSSKMTIVKDSGQDRTLKSSKSFFGRLQEEVASEIKGVRARKRPKPLQTLSSKKLKL